MFHIGDSNVCSVFVTDDKKNSQVVLWTMLSVNWRLTVGTWGYSSERAQCHRACNCSGTQVICIGGH